MCLWKAIKHFLLESRELVLAVWRVPWGDLMWPTIVVKYCATKRSTRSKYTVPVGPEGTFWPLSPPRSRPGLLSPQPIGGQRSNQRSTQRTTLDWSNRHPSDGREKSWTPAPPSGSVFEEGVCDSGQSCLIGPSAWRVGQRCERGNVDGWEEERKINQT